MVVPMSETFRPSAAALRKAAEIREKIEKLEDDYSAIMLGKPADPARKVSTRKRTKRKLSAAGRARIVAAQKKRWAKVKGE